MLPHNIQFNTINLPVTDASLRIQMQQMARFRNLVGDGQNLRCVCTVAGYGDDPRELWEIPEVQDLCKRLIKIGYISLLDTMPNVDLPNSPASSRSRDLLDYRLNTGDHGAHGRYGLSRVASKGVMVWI